MKKHLLFLLSLCMPLCALAQTVTSPGGKVAVTFSLDHTRPCYSMTYCGKQVLKPSYLGLKLAKSKHASKEQNETDLMDGFIRGMQP